MTVDKDAGKRCSECVSIAMEKGAGKRCSECVSDCGGRCRKAMLGVCVYM